MFQNIIKIHLSKILLNFDKFQYVNYHPLNKSWINKHQDNYHLIQIAIIMKEEEWIIDKEKNCVKNKK